MASEKLTKEQRKSMSKEELDAYRKQQKEARQQKKLNAELAKDEERLSASPAENAEKYGQQVTHNQLDKEPTVNTYGDKGVFIENPFLRGVQSSVIGFRKMNPIAGIQSGVRRWQEGDKLGGFLDIAGIPSLVKGGMAFADNMAHGTKGGVYENDPIYGEKYKMEKEQQKMEEAKNNPVTPKKETVTTPSKTGTSLLDNTEEKPATSNTPTEYEGLVNKIHQNYGSVYNEDVQKLPTFMKSAYKNGAFGTPGSKDAKTRMGYFIANHLGTIVANTLGGIGNAAMANAGKAGTYQEQASDWDKMQETNLVKGMETNWQREQAKLANDIQALKDITGTDVHLINDRKEQDYFIKQSERLGKNYGELNDEQKAMVITGQLLKKYQETGDAKALAGASAISKVTETGMFNKVMDWLGLND